MLASQTRLADDFWRCAVESALANTAVDSNSNQSDDDYDESSGRQTVCLISDRFAQPGLNLSSAHSSWLWSLQESIL
jgi:hypothetical protein